MHIITVNTLSEIRTVKVFQYSGTYHMYFNISIQKISLLPDEGTQLSDRKIGDQWSEYILIMRFVMIGRYTSHHKSSI